MPDPNIIMIDQLLRMATSVALGTTVACCVVGLFALAGYTIYRAWVR